LLAFIVIAAALWIPQSTGSIAGCIVDSARQPLPGVTVIATGESLRHTTETTKAGCYELKGLAPGSYRVTTRLQGFTNVTRDNVAVAAGSGTPLDVTMNVSGMCDCVLVNLTLAEHVSAADAVLHLRITGPRAGQPPGATYYQHAATVLHAVKSAGSPESTIPLVQDQTSGAPDPYDRNQEMVAFLRSAQGLGFAIVNGNPALNSGKQQTAMVFLVRDGQIIDAPTKFSRYIGATLESFMYDLRPGVRAK
jgi:hypothetical protein